MNRREFLATTAAASTLAFGATALRSTPASAQATYASGADLSGWRTVLGDGQFVGPGQSPLSLDDVETVHSGTHSSLRANIHERGVMAHNITFDRFSDRDGMNKTHIADVEFRIPTVPDDGNWSYNCQTLEIGVFVWDGADTRQDHGIALQWMLNPWIEEFGTVRAWSMVDGAPEWVPVGYLEPDTEWHAFRCAYRPGGPASIRIDETNVEVAETITPKDPSWGPTVDGRFQVEIVSVWPGVNPTVPAHSADFRNWSWRITG